MEKEVEILGAISSLQSLYERLIERLGELLTRQDRFDKDLNEMFRKLHDLDKFLTGHDAKSEAGGKSMLKLEVKVEALERDVEDLKLKQAAFPLDRVLLGLATIAAMAAALMGVFK